VAGAGPYKVTVRVGGMVHENEFAEFDTNGRYSMRLPVTSIRARAGTLKIRTTLQEGTPQKSWIFVRPVGRKFLHFCKEPSSEETFPFLAPGEYFVRAKMPSKSLVATERTIRIEANETRQVDLILRSSTMVEGRVEEFDKDCSTRKVLISGLTEEGRSFSQTTPLKNSGRFSLSDIPSGRYTILALNCQSFFGPAEIEVGPGREQHDLILSRNRETRPVRFRLVRKSSNNGRLVFVEVQDEAGYLFAQKYAGPDERELSVYLPPGDYELIYAVGVESLDAGYYRPPATLDLLRISVDAETTTIVIP